MTVSLTWLASVVVRAAWNWRVLPGWFSTGLVAVRVGRVAPAGAVSA